MVQKSYAGRCYQPIGVARGEAFARKGRASCAIDQEAITCEAALSLPTRDAEVQAPVESQCQCDSWSLKAVNPTQVYELK
ncbi:hypothetical protein KCU88_g290, partial [Aureobasidium melanogenum]